MAPISSVCCWFLIAGFSIFVYFFQTFLTTGLSNVKEGRLRSEEIVSSVWCRGKERNKRTCRFKNLCYLPSVNQFVFYFNNVSEIAGLDAEEHFFRNVVDTSSIENHNLLTLSFIVVPPSSSDIRIVSSSVFLINRFKPDNLMHVIHDDLFPLYHTYNEICFGDVNECRRKFSLLLIDGHSIDFFPQLYEIFGNEVITLPSDEPVCYKEVYAGMSKETVWYQFGFHGEQGPTNSPLNGFHIRRFAEFLLRNVKGQGASCPENGTILLSRKRTRRILNEAELLRQLNNNVITLSLENDDLLKIFHCVRNARILIGMHGSLLISSLFLQSNSSLLELFPTQINSSQITPYKTLVKLPFMGVHYEAWEDNKGTKDYIKPGLCCDDPTWLQFINQDTIVDVQQITMMVDHMGTDMDSFPSKWEKSLLYPSSPASVECRRSLGQLLLKWKQPWNVALMGSMVRKVNYDLMLVGQNFQKQYLTDQENFNVKIADDVREVRVWIKCLVNDMYQSVDVVLLCA